MYLWLIPSYIVSSLLTDFVPELLHHLHSDLVPNNLHSDHVHCFFHACVFADFLVVTELSIFLLLSKNKDQCKLQIAQDSYLIVYTARYTFKTKTHRFRGFLLLSTSLDWKTEKKNPNPIELRNTKMSKHRGASHIYTRLSADQLILRLVRLKSYLTFSLHSSFEMGAIFAT